MCRIAHEVAGIRYTEASIAATRSRAASGVLCSDSRMRTSWRKALGRGEANGKSFECFRGEDISTCRWNSRVPASFLRDSNNESLRLIINVGYVWRCLYGPAHRSREACSLAYFALYVLRGSGEFESGSQREFLNIFLLSGNRDFTNI